MTISVTTPFDDLVAAYCAAYALPEPVLGVSSSAPLAPISCIAPAQDAPICLIFSPHPDDESLSGALALRLRHQHGWRVINCAVTLGSRESRRAARWLEAQAACDYLGFELIQAGNLTRSNMLESQATAAIAQLLKRYQPRVVLCPHALDGHPVHMGTHTLVQKALASSRLDQPCHALYSEYWNTQLSPQLMLGLNAAQVAQLVTATALHTGEVARNPYHRTLPAWLMDGARRGAERVGLAGSAHTGLQFAALHGWEVWEKGEAKRMPAHVAHESDNIEQLFL